MHLGLSRHDTLIFESREWIVQARTATGYLLSGKHDQLSRLVTNEELVEAYDERKLEFQTSNGCTTGEPDFSAKTKFAQSEALKRQKILTELRQILGPRPYSNESLLKAVPAACEVANCNAVSLATVRRWLQMDPEGRSARKLAPKRHGPNRRQLNASLERLIDDAIDKYLMKSRPAKIDAAWNFLCEEISREVAKDPSVDLSPPSRATFYRRFHAINRELVTLKQKGRRAARDQHKMVRPGPSELGPYSAIEFDHTPVNCLLTTSDGIVIGRPWLIAAVDRHTRMCAGVILTFAPPNGMTILLLVRQVILGKNKILKQYSAIRNDWPCRGRFTRAIVDNGFEFHKVDLSVALQEIGIGIEYCATRDPEKKGKVERFLLTLQTGLIEDLPGATLGMFDRNRDFDPATAARLTIEKFSEFVLRFIVDIYHQRSHGGLSRAAPIDLWNSVIPGYEIDLGVSREDLDVVCLYRSERSIRRDGISLGGYLYQSRDLHTIRVNSPKFARHQVRYNPLDLGEILVLDPLTQRFVTVPSVFSEAKGTSEWQRTAVLNHLGKSAGGASAARVRSAQYELHKDAQAELEKGPPSKQLGRKKQAMRTRSRFAGPDGVVVARTMPPANELRHAMAPVRREAGPPSVPEAIQDLDHIVLQSGMRSRRRIVR